MGCFHYDASPPPPAAEYVPFLLFKVNAERDQLLEHGSNYQSKPKWCLKDDTELPNVGLISVKRNGLIVGYLNPLAASALPYPTFNFSNLSIVVRMLVNLRFSLRRDLIGVRMVG